MSGFAGKIARINLTTGSISTIDTADYEQWGGGHGIGSALFYDIAVKEKGLDLENMDHNSSTDGGFHPDNVITLMTSPLSATGVPAATGRTVMQGIGVQSYPIGWFTRSNFGGRFGPMLKFAGFDGLVIEGSSSEPVWIDIREGKVWVRPCSELSLWGKDTYETQDLIWKYINKDSDGGWELPVGMDIRTTQVPAILCIGQAGENKNRMGCLIHDAGFVAGQGGFGGIWGAKNLKAVSVYGTGTIPVDDPAELLGLRIAQRDYQWRYENHQSDDRYRALMRHNNPPNVIDLYGDGPGGREGEDCRPVSCMGCHAGCRARYKSGKANEIRCATTLFYADSESLDTQIEAVEMLNRYGVNSYDMVMGMPWIKSLYERGYLGNSGQPIQTDLNFGQYGSVPFIRAFFEEMTYRSTPFGDDLSEGFRRAAQRWGREADLGETLMYPYWGIPEHGYDPRAELEWGYGSLLDTRDITEHCINTIHYYGTFFPLLNLGDRVSAEQTVSLFTEKMVPHCNDYTNAEDRMQMLNFATDNMYSQHIVRLLSWHRHYTRYFKNAMLFCDMKWPDIINNSRPDRRGSTGTAEPAFIKAVTGKEVSFLEGMEMGRKIWNLDNAVWVLQGRHRDMVHFADYIYEKDLEEAFKLPTYDPTAAYTSRRWDYRDVSGRHLDKASFDQFKTAFYLYEGWDTATGWPLRATLEQLGLSNVADTLSSHGKL